MTYFAPEFVSFWERGVSVAAHPAEGVLRPGGWAVMGNGGMLHLAETVGGLPRGRALCGAVGTAFVVSATPQPSRVCEQCTQLARAAEHPSKR